MVWNDCAKRKTSRRDRLPRSVEGNHQLHGGRPDSRNARAGRSSFERVPPLQSCLRRIAECSATPWRQQRARATDRLQPAVTRSSFGRACASLTTDETDLERASPLSLDGEGRSTALLRSDSNRAAHEITTEQIHQVSDQLYGDERDRQSPSHSRRRNHPTAAIPSATASSRNAAPTVGPREPVACRQLDSVPRLDQEMYRATLGLCRRGLPYSCRRAEILRQP